MRIVYSLVLSIGLSVGAYAQSWQPPTLPQAPQPATISPAMVVMPTQSANQPQQNMSKSDPTAIYEADRRQVENEQQRQAAQRIQDDVKGLYESKPSYRYATATQPSDPHAASYLQAYNELNDMLTGKRPASLKRAVFLVENAYYENKMSYQEYSQHIETLAAFCRLKLRLERADTTNDEVKNNMVFRVLSEPLTITDPHTGKKVTSEPLHYDFDDFYGRKDWSKMFVTKLLNTGYGQCHSMPLLFNIVAAELGAQAYMSFSPSHCFAKYKSGNTFKNIELTNGHITSDAWVLASGFVKAEALRSHIYLDTVGLRWIFR